MGPTDTPARGDTLIESLERSARRGGSARAFTFVDHGAGQEPRRDELTWQRLATRVRAVAAQLQKIATPGDRAAVLARQGPEYVVSVLAASHAGLIAVPLFAPAGTGQTERLGTILADCTPAIVLTGTVDAAAVRALVDGALPARPRMVAADAVPDGLATAWRDPGTDPDDLAYLQYTSGSTRTPAGVMISHRSVLANVDQIARAYDLSPQRNTCAGWLPLFHDMGLIVLVLLPVVAGMPSTIMTPQAFVQRPLRWLKLLSASPGAFTAAPDFAYQHCVRRVREADLADLRLHDVHAMINGAEQVRPATIEAFQSTFGGAGLPPAAHRPSYGMAEATVFVAAAAARPRPRVTSLDRDELADGRVVARDGSDVRATRHASCGVPVGQQALVVDPQARTAKPEGEVGELWISGPNLGQGYWGRPIETAETFAAELAGGDGQRWLRTGDLAVVHDGELYITGRLKDMIIVDGRNHYPQDVEATVCDAHPGIRRDRVAAFSVPGGGHATDQDGEGLVVVAELGPRPAGSAADAEPDAIVTAIRRAVAEYHALALRDVLLVRAGRVPRTSSGKLARRACRQRYLDDPAELLGAAGQQRKTA